MNDQNLSIFYRLKNISTQALKAKDTALRTKANTAQSDLKSIIEETRLKAKQATTSPIEKSEEVVAINSLINRLSKGTLLENGSTFVAPDIEEYIEFLKQFQPAQLSKDKIKQIIEEHGFTSMKDAMPFFKVNYPNQFSPKDIKALLN